MRWGLCRIAATIIQVSGRQLCLKPVKTINRGLETAFTVLGKDAMVAVIPQGPLVLPVLDEK